MCQKIMKYRNDGVDFTTRNLIYLVMSSLLVGPKLGTEAYTLNCTTLDEKPHYEIHCKGISADDHEHTPSYIRFPRNLNKDATYIHIVLENPLSNPSTDPKHLYIDRMTIFNSFRRLAVLHIEANREGGIFITTDLKSQMDILQSQLFNLPYLEELKIETIQFEDENHAWVLPEHLEYLTIKFAGYSGYDLSNFRYLRAVNFEGNHFTKLPLFYYPLHSLETLDMSDNPLNEVTTNDIANLCGLRKFYIRGTSFFSKQRYCECLRLKRWIQKMIDWENSKETFQTYIRSIIYPDCVINNDTNCTEADLDLKEAMKLRELCLAATE